MTYYSCRSAGLAVPVVAGHRRGFLRGRGLRRVPARGERRRRRRQAKHRPSLRRRRRGAGAVAGADPHLRHPNQALPPGAVGGRGPRVRRDLPRRRAAAGRGPGAVRAGASRRPLVRWAHVRCAHRSRLQGRYATVGVLDFGSQYSIWPTAYS